VRLSLLLFLISSISYGQITFQTSYGVSTNDRAYSVQQCFDKGYIITGSTNNNGAGGADLFLIKTDVYGDTVWTKTYGGPANEVGYDVQQTTDSGYIITGLTLSYDTVPSIFPDGFLIKTDVNGDTLWTTLFTGVEQEEGRAVQQCEDGGYIVCGVENTFGPGQMEIFLAKYNSIGQIQWGKEYGGTNAVADWGNSVQQTTDGGYIIAGMATSYGSGIASVYLIKTDTIGDTLWTRTFGGTGIDFGECVQQCTDGGYIVCGYTESFGAGNKDAYLIKTDSNGDTLWTKTYGGTGEEYAYAVQQTTDGGYIISGYTTSFGNGFSFDAYLIKTDASGDTLWTRRYGDSTIADGAQAMQQCADGGYIIAGTTALALFGASDIYLIKTDANGNSGCNEYGWNPTVGNPPTIVQRGALVFSGYFEGHFPFVIDYAALNDTTLCYDSLVDINEQEIQENQLIIYPNPTTGIFTVQGATGEIQVYDLFGRLVLRSNNQQVDMGSYPNGMYMVRIGEVVKKVILQ